MAYNPKRPISQWAVPYSISDVSTAGQTCLAVPVSGKVVMVRSVLGAAITGADATLTVKKNGSSSMGTITVTQSGSAQGDVDELEPTSNNVVTETDYIEVETDGGSTGTVEVTGLIIIDPNLA